MCEKHLFCPWHKLKIQDMYKFLYPGESSCGLNELWINSVAPGGDGCNLKFSNFQTHLKDGYIQLFLSEIALMWMWQDLMDD